MLWCQYGKLIENTKFLREIRDYECVWAIIKSLKKVTFDPSDRIYLDKELSEMIYFIHSGHVKLFAENQYPFKVYRPGDVFGESEVFCNLRRNGTAIVIGTNQCELYQIRKS